MCPEKTPADLFLQHLSETVLGELLQKIVVMRLPSETETVKNSLQNLKATVPVRPVKAYGPSQPQALHLRWTTAVGIAHVRAHVSEAECKGESPGRHNVTQTQTHTKNARRD